MQFVWVELIWTILYRTATNDCIIHKLIEVFKETVNSEKSWPVTVTQSPSDTFAKLIITHTLKYFTQLKGKAANPHI